MDIKTFFSIVEDFFEEIHPNILDDNDKSETDETPETTISSDFNLCNFFTEFILFMGWHSNKIN